MEFSEELEQLIDSAMADGFISEKERAVLHKRAVAEGLDPDEFDVVLDALLVKKQQRSAPKSAPQIASKSSNMLLNADLSKVSKQIGSGATYYETNEKFQLSPQGVPIRALYMSFIYVVNHESGENKNGLGIHVFGVLDDNWFSSSSSHSIVLKSDNNSFQLELNIWYYKDILSPIVGKKQAELNFAVQIDADLLKQLCSAKNFSLSVDNIEIYARYNDKNRKEFSIENCGSSYDFAKYAQMAYRSLIDPSAFPNTEVQSAKAIENQDDIAQLLGVNENTLQKIQTDAPCYKQYRDITSNMTVFHFSDSNNLNGSNKNNNKNYHFTLKLHAIKKEEEELKYYFELESSIPYDRNDKGEKTKEYPLGLNFTSISISVGTKSFFMPPITNSKELLSSQISRSDEEHNYYAIESELMNLLIQADGFELVIISGNDGASIKASGFMNEVSMSKKWKLAYNLLTYPEQKEQLLQEYNDSKISTKIFKGIKGLFGK